MMGETANNLLQKEILLNGHRNDSDTLAHNDILDNMIVCSQDISKR